MVKVHRIHQSNGQYILATDGETFDIDTPNDYADGVVEGNQFVQGYAIDGQFVDPSDTDLQNEIDAARNAVLGGHGRIVAFRFDYGIELYSLDVR